MSAQFFLWPEERTLAIFFATPFSRCGLSAPLSFFLRADFLADGDMLVQTVETAKELKSNMAEIGIYA